MGAVALVWLVLDQITKHWALNALADDRIIDVVGSLRFNLAFNTGTAFGFGAGLGPLVAIVAVVIAGVLIKVAGDAPSRGAAMALGLLLGGAVGNLVDRVFRAGDGFLGGAVVDFIDLQWWPIFNLADVGIVVGGILLVIIGWFAEEPPPDADELPADELPADELPADELPADELPADEPRPDEPRPDGPPR